MIRAELERELRETARNPRTPDRGNLDRMLLRAAAALEEEERDARRWRGYKQLRQSMGWEIDDKEIDAWLEEEDKDARRYKVLKIVATAEALPLMCQIRFTVPERCIPKKRISYSVWDDLDAALDAWLEEHQDG